MPDKRIKVGVIGAGRAGMIHAHNFATSIENSRVVAVVDPSIEQASRAKLKLNAEYAYQDYRDAIASDNIDAIVIATPTKYHKEIVLAAAEAGKHILCEKPMAMDKDECQEMIAVAKKNNIKLQIGFMRRFDKSFIAAKERIDSGEIGDVVMVRSLTYGPTTPKPWMYDISKSNGPLAEVNSHDIDTLRWYTKSEFKEVYAIAGNFRSSDAREKFPEFYDNVNLNASFENGMQGSICGAQGVQYGYDSRCEILGTKGIIFVGGLEDCSMISCNSNGMSRPIVKSWMNLFEEAYLEEDRHFIECVLEDKEPKVTGYDGMKAVEVVNAGNKSINEKCIIHFSEEN
jgi:myo-inositol 2-dehydrogenase/D-chiro-inositol 1-dehydrogenase/scyllo-inositol 2-dehydrogenase (NAD+)